MIHSESPETILISSATCWRWTPNGESEEGLSPKGAFLIFLFGGRRTISLAGNPVEKLILQAEKSSLRILYLSRRNARIFTEVQMALATFAAEVQIQDRLNELGTTAQFLSAIDGRISNSRLSQALRGLKDLENPDAERLLALTKRMVEFRECFSTVPIAWKNPVDVQ